MEIQDLSLLSRYTAPDEAMVDQLLAQALAELNRKIVVLDDDPTGVQTVHGVPVFTRWDKDTLREGFEEEGSMFFILTNSRSFSKEQTRAVHAQIGETLCHVSRESGQDYILISRSDSTMRGHFPLETQTLQAAIQAHSEKRFDGEIIVPFFKEGGRLTIDNIHYVREGDQLIPAGQTEFAKDKSFGFSSSHLGDYVEEKTESAFKREDCTFIGLEDLRSVSLDKIYGQLMCVQNFRKVIVNAIDYVDIKVFIIAFIRAVLAGKEFLFRSAAAIPKVLGGVPDADLLKKFQLIDEENYNGGIVLIGSHVRKTTRQFEALRTCAAQMEFLEFNQHLVLEPGGLEREVDRVIALVDTAISQGRNITVYTRRERFDLDTDDKDAQLRISTQISDAVTSIIGKLTVRPNFIIAKGGITSSDVGTKALHVRRALVMGQVKPGIPVWMTGPESKFPQMPYVIFPGNVGEDDTLRDIVDSLS